MDELEKKIRVDEAAEKIKLLFGFAATLIPYKDLLEETVKMARGKVSTIEASAVIISAFGEDYFGASEKAKAKAERAEALYNFIDVLDRTEREMQAAGERRLREKTGRDWVNKLIG